MRVLLAVLLVLAGASPAEAARGIKLGFFDTGAFTGPDGERWLDRAQALNADIVRVAVSWPSVAPSEPANARDPADPAYDWDAVDRIVAQSRVRGFEVLLSIDQAPAWVSGPNRPRDVSVGAWRPDPEAVGAFAEALARRYVTQVRHFQVWNEPNLDAYLAPQWRRSGSRWVREAPHRYRAMLNAAYAGINRVDAANRLVTAGTAPYGDPFRGGRRTRPVHFWRTVFKRRARFDVLAHHPYGVGGPRRRARHKGDVAIPDLRRLRTLTRKPLWVTEISWDSRPPDPRGVPERRHARWLAEAFFTLWKQKVRAITWFQIRDQAAERSYAATNQSGVFLVDGRPKLAARAFGFPFACEDRGRGVRVWLKAPRRGPVDILDRRGRTVRRLSTRGSLVVTATVPAAYRARSGAAVSLPCQIR